MEELGQLVALREENAVLRAENAKLREQQQEVYGLHSYIQQLSAHVQQQLAQQAKFYEAVKDAQADQIARLQSEIREQLRPEVSSLRSALTQSEDQRRAFEMRSESLERKLKQSESQLRNLLKLQRKDQGFIQSRPRHSSNRDSAKDLQTVLDQPQYSGFPDDSFNQSSSRFKPKTPTDQLDMPSPPHKASTPATVPVSVPVRVTDPVLAAPTPAPPAFPPSNNILPRQLKELSASNVKSEDYTSDSQMQASESMNQSRHEEFISTSVSAMRSREQGARFQKKTAQNRRRKVADRSLFQER